MADEPETTDKPDAGEGVAQRFGSELKLAFQRIVQGDFEQIKASDEERAELAAAARPVKQSLAQDYAAWRKSILIVASALLVVAALFKVVRFQSFESMIVESEMQAAEQQGANVAESDVRTQVIERVGRDNLDTVNLLFIMDLSVILLAALLVVLAARGWAGIRGSRRMARRAWYIWLLLPITMALIPWVGLLEFHNMPTAQAEQLKASFGLMLGVGMVVFLGPKLVTIFPGVIRSGLLLKTLVPETGHSIWAAILCAPIFVLMLILSLAGILQIKADALLLISVLCFMLAPVSYLRQAKVLMQPMTGKAAAELIRQVRIPGYVLNGIGALFMLIFVLKHELVTWDGAITMFATALGGLFLMMVVTSDFLLALLHVSFKQAGELYGTKKAAALERKLKALSAGGLTDLLTPADVPESPPEEQAAEEKAAEEKAAEKKG